MATKDDLVTALAAKSGQPKTAVYVVLGAMPEVMVSELNERGEVRIAGVGIFKSKYVAARKMKNFLEQGKEMNVPARMRVVCKTASTLAPALKMKAKK